MLLGILLMFLAFASESKFWVFPYVSFIGGLVLVIAMILYPKFTKPLYVSYDDSGLRGRISPFKEIEVQWNQISDVDVSMFLIILKLKTGEEHKLKLDGLTFEQHRSDKPKLVEFMRSKGVSITASPAASGRSTL